MRKLYKSLILAAIPWFVALASYSTFPIFLGEPVTPIWEAGGFTVFHGILDSVAIFLVANVIFEA